jgi:hypothetical protein
MTELLPIVLPTLAELSRLSHRQLVALAKDNLNRSEDHAHITFLALVEIKQRASWRPQYSTLAAMIRAELEVSVPRSYQIIKQIEVHLNTVSTAVENGEVNGHAKKPIPEWQARILAELPEAEQQREALEMARVLAGEEPVAARHVREAVDSFKASAEQEAEEETKSEEEEKAEQWKATEGTKTSRVQSLPCTRVQKAIDDALVSLRRATYENTPKSERKATLAKLMTLVMESAKLTEENKRQEWKDTSKMMRKMV